MNNLKVKSWFQLRSSEMLCVDGMSDSQHSTSTPFCHKGRSVYSEGIDQGEELELGEVNESFILL